MARAARSSRRARSAKWFAAFALAVTGGAAQAEPLLHLSTFQDTPDPVASTEQLTYELQVTNTSLSETVTGVTLTVPIPAGLTSISVSDPACSYSAPDVLCSFGDLPANTVRLITITSSVTASSGSSLSSTAVASTTTGGETDSSITQTTTVTAGADLQLSMNASPDPVTAGGLVTYTLTTSNLGPDASSGLSITDTLPPNVSYVSSSGDGWSCSDGGGTVACNRPGSLAPGAGTVLNIVARVNSSINGNITNSATVSAAIPDGIPNNNTTTASVAVLAGADLSITKNASPLLMIADAAATFTLHPRNSGPDAGASVTVSDTLPVGFNTIAASGSNWSCSVDQPSRTVTCSRASLPAGSTDDITITATAPDDTVVPPAGMSTSNTATISGTTTDPDNTNNSGSVDFTIQRDGADISIFKSKSPNPVAQGSPLTSVLRATNNGPRALTGGDTITITDTLPAGEDYSGPPDFTSNGWSCDFAAPTFTCSRAGPLAVGATTPNLTLVTTASANGTLTNQGCVAVSGSFSDPNGTNDCTSAGAGSTTARADLTIVKSQDLATVTTSDDTLTYTLTITNDGPQDSADVVVRDVIPMHTTLAGATVISANAGTGSKGSTGSCSVSTSTVTCNYPALLFETGAPANTAETAVVTITVQRPMADGSFTNTATVDSTSIGDPDRGDNSSSVITTVDPIADVQVESKTVTPNPVLAGVDTTYVITFSNRGPSAAQNVTLSDQFNPAPGDTGYELRSLTSSKGSCSFNAPSDVIDCSVGTLIADEAQTVTAVVRPNWMATPPADRNLPNTATVATTTADSDAGNDSQSATLDITSANVDLIANVSDVQSVAGVPPDPLGYDGTDLPSNVVTYRVSITNAGPSEATSVSFQNTFSPPSGRTATFLWDSADQLSDSGSPVCTVSGSATVTGPTEQVVNCVAPNLDAGESYVRYLRYRIDTAPAPAGDSYSNRVTVASNETDVGGTNNSATEPTAVRAKADMRVSAKTAVIAAPPLQFGQTFQWEITVVNDGPGNGYDVVLSDILPTDMELVAPFNYSVNPPGGTCTANSITEFDCNLGTIVPSDQTTVTVDVVIQRPPAPPYPASYANIATVSTFSVDLNSANDSNSGSVSLVKSSIAGRVYRDHDNDGVIDAGENGIAGVTLTLTGSDIFGNAVSRTTTSDGSGNYIFDDLEQADATGYTITQTQPAGYSDGLETAGTAATGTPPGGNVSAAVGSNTITAIVLDKEQAAAGYNFGDLRLNTLGGRVFADMNNDGVQQGGEPGIADVTITLTGTDARGDAVNRTATTNGSGNYSFANVLPGTYQLDETQPPTYLDGIDTVGTLGGSGAVNDRFSGIDITDVNGTGYNFAELPGSIGGRVWHDIDRNGVIDAGEPGIAGVTVTLSGTDGLGAAVNRTATTDASGNYSFDDLPQGTYTVTETQPASYGSSTPDSIGGIALAAGGTGAGHDFGDTTSSLSGRVFFDRNGNGVLDGSDTGIGGVAFTLTGTSAGGTPVNLAATSDASGNFTFPELLAPNGSGYTLTQTQPAAYANGQITAGSAGGAADQAQNRVTEIAVIAGSDATAYSFAELGTPISGTVYRDANRNGAQEPGEVGLPDVTVSLYDAADVLVATTTTAADGSYDFPPQPGGSYTVVQTQPAGYESGPENAGNSVAIALTAGTPAQVNFGESAGSLAGTVFLDGNDDGIQDAGEIGLPGVTVTLSGTDANGDPVGSATTTNASGAYRFDDLLSGTYTITETQPAQFGDGQEVPGPGNVGGTIGNDVYSAIALPPGREATGYNFAELGSAVVGVVFRDANRDGTQQPGDQGIANVTITLRDAGDAVVATTTTAGDGSYLFGGIAAGDYSVVETQPAGYGSAATSPDSVAVTVPAGGAATANFADTLSTLAGSVYIDLDDDGVRDAGEPGIDGVTITLTGTDAAGGAVNRVATTGADGNFLFIDLLTPDAAGYTLTETQPTAYADGTDSAGSAGGTALDDVIQAIMLPENTDAVDYRFGELGTTLSGVVYKDVDADGTRDGDDPGIGGVTITLRDGLGAVVATTVTAADGAYVFAGLPSGNYTVEETQPAGYGSSTPDSVSVTVGAGAAATADFGETTSSIAGSVWSDANGDGARDPGEPGIAGVTITLTGTDAAGDAVNRTTTTDAAGDFLFEDVLGGTYVLTETQPAEYADGSVTAGSAGGTAGTNTVTAIALPAGTAATGYLFAELGQSVTGRVWLDSDRDGEPDDEEAGIAGVTITLTDTDTGAVFATTVTGADGRYMFANVPAGQYSVAETQPDGYGSSTPDTVAVPIVAGGATPIVNFGDTAGSLAGIVYNDTDNDGIKDADEPPIAGVLITLTGTDARGNAVSRDATTGKDGRYRFADVVGGTYELAEVQPPEYGDGIDSVGTAGGTLGNDVITAIPLASAFDADGYNFGERGENASIAGTIWRDRNHDRVRDPDEPLMAQWIVELYQSSLLVQSTTTDSAGNYVFTAVPPGSGYEIRFREPASEAVYGMPVTNEQGVGSSAGVTGAGNPGGADTRGGTILGLTLAPGAQVNEQSLPLDPMGVVYDSVSREPVAGATVTLSGPAGYDPAVHLVGGAANAAQVTNGDGIYQFLLLPGAPAGTYDIEVTPPPGRYSPGPSVLIPACPGPLDVGPVPDPALIQPTIDAPAPGVPNLDAADCPSASAGLGGEATTQYFFSFILTPGNSSDVINNHVPIDPILGGALAVTKHTPMVNVSRGDLVPYTITVTNTLDAELRNVDVRDLLPPGFAYRRDSATVEGAALEPARAGRQVTWTDQVFAPQQSRTYRLVLVVGAGVGEGEYVNQAFGINNLVGATISNVATAAVRVVPDPVFDCADVVGKVFDDRNANGYQDEGEPGLANVRLATLRGVLVTSDADGRFHVACAAIPNEYRGSNFVMKLDERTLPSGYRVTTENPRDVRVTRGKLVKLNFGVTIHRVVRVELTDDAFETGSERLRTEWRERIEQLPEVLRKQPSVVRVAYAADGGGEKLAARRKEAVVRRIRDQWEALDCCYALQVEAEREEQP